MAEKILVVNEKDEIIRAEDKERCHDGNGILHRALIVIVLNSKGNVLLTKRSNSKRLWPGYWEASIATHPIQKETYEQAAERRLKEELGISNAALRYLFKFQYKARYKNEGSENEVCAVLACKYDGQIKPAAAEISEHRFISFNELKKNHDKEEYAPWMKIAIEKMAKEGID